MPLVAACLSTESDFAMADAPTPNVDETSVDAPKNVVTTEEAGPLKQKVTVTIPEETVREKLDEMYGELADSAQVPGFRVGHAPRRLLEKRFGKDVADDVRNSLIGEALGDAIEQTDLKTIGEPDINLDDIELPEAGEMVFSFDVEVEPEFDLPELKGIAVKKPVLEATDERIDEYMDNIVQSQAKYEKTDDPAGDGDQVVCAVKITGDDIEFENPRLSLRVAPGVVEGIAIADLAKSLEGKKVDDAVEIVETVSDAHANEDWRGKEVTITLTVHEVSKREVPEVTEEMATGMGFDDLAALRAYVAEQITSRSESEAQQAMRTQLRESLAELVTDMPLPEGLVKRYTARTLQRTMVQMMQYGLPQEKVAEMMAEMQVEAEKQAKNDLRLSFLLNKVAEANDIDVSEDEVNMQISQMAMQYQRRPEKMKAELAADGTMEVLADSIREDKALNKILEDADVTDVDPAVLQAENEAKAKAAQEAAETKE